VAAWSHAIRLILAFLAIVGRSWHCELLDGDAAGCCAGSDQAQRVAMGTAFARRMMTACLLRGNVVVQRQRWHPVDGGT